MIGLPNQLLPISWKVAVQWKYGSACLQLPTHQWALETDYQVIEHLLMMVLRDISSPRCDVKAVYSKFWPFYALIMHMIPKVPYLYEKYHNMTSFW